MGVHVAVVQQGLHDLLRVLTWASKDLLALSETSAFLTDPAVRRLRNDEARLVAGVVKDEDALEQSSRFKMETHAAFLLAVDQVVDSTRTAQVPALKRSLSETASWSSPRWPCPTSPVGRPR